MNITMQGRAISERPGLTWTALTGQANGEQGKQAGLAEHH